MSKSKSHRELQFENEHVAVWKTVIVPNQPLEMHRHDGARVVIGLKGGKLERIDADGSRQDLLFDTHKAYWLTPDSHFGFHGDLNEGKEPVEVMVVEMKKPKSRPLPSKPID